MNANELIEFQEDKASEARANGFSDVRFMQTATMLRKLDGQLAFRIDAVSKYQVKVEEQHAEIEALKAKLSLWEEFGRQVVGTTRNEATR